MLLFSADVAVSGRPSKPAMKAHQGTLSVRVPFRTSEVILKLRIDGWNLHSHERSQATSKVWSHLHLDLEKRT